MQWRTANISKCCAVLCRERGFVGIYPLDASVPPTLAPNEKAKWIYTANVAAIRSADVVMANLNDFRGPGEPDSGTGFAAGLGKPVWGYRESAASLIDHVPSISHGQAAVCDGGFLVEDFEMRINLMLECASTLVVSGPQECLGQMRASGAFNCPPFLATKCTKPSFVQNGECANSVYLFL